MSDAPLQIGMIGCGYWGPNLLRNFAKLEGAQVKMVADRSEERRKFVRDGYPQVQTVEDAQRVLEDDEIRAVIVATPADTHAALARQVLEAGKDVFVEKPLAMKTSEAVALTELAQDKGLILMVGHTFLYNEAVRTLKRHIDSGDLGKIYYLYSQRLNLGIVRSDINASWNLAPHDISIGNYLVGETPIRVAASGVQALQPEAPRLDDVVFMSLTYPSGVVMHTHVSWLDPRKIRTMTVVGDKKMIVYDDVAQDKLQIYNKGITRGERVPEEQASDFARHKMITRAGDLLVPNLRIPEPLSVEAKHFLQCVRTRQTPVTDGHNGIAVTAVLEAVDLSLARGGAPVDIEIPRLGK